MSTTKLAIIGFPFDDYSSYLKGCSLAPPALRAAFHSESSNYWSEQNIKIEIGKQIVDCGDVSFNPKQSAFELIENNIRQLLDQGYAPVSLGGDHSITSPIIKAISRSFHRLNVLHFDAHPDLYDEFQGNRNSHACPFARIMEAGQSQRLVQIGIRTMNAHQREQVERFGVEVIEMKDWQDEISLHFDAPLYLSFDMDALDPAFAPGVSHHEPGGFSTRQVINIIHKIKTSVIIGADIVEFNPTRDINGITAMTAAKLLKEIAGRMLLV